MGEKVLLTGVVFVLLSACLLSTSENMREADYPLTVLFLGGAVAMVAGALMRIWS